MNDKKMTMMGRFFTQKILRQMVKNNCKYAIVETTSEGIEQFRHKFINYDVLVFTGLYAEHIEAHGSFENYKQAKGKLFAHLEHCSTKYINDKKTVIKSASGIKKIDLTRLKKVIIANGNDKYLDYFTNFKADEKIIYKQVNTKVDTDLSDMKQLYYSFLSASAQGTKFKIEEQNIGLKLLGVFNIENAMNAYSVAVSQDITKEKIKQGLESIAGVAGRLEGINEGQDFGVIVDYAFEPNALSKLYDTLKLFPHQKVIHVLGSAGGGRDVARRPILGKIAGDNADIVIITNEDPYDDDPEVIMDQVALGAEKAGKKINTNLFKILERRDAIKKAINLAKKDDIVLITGKGNEQAICVANGEKIPWDDRAVVRGILNAIIS
jgi:UDP-N-acetylmuramoyl-L-alanyl-D-glutamate--2,6-diaminopimelate ligase